MVVYHVRFEKSGSSQGPFPMDALETLAERNVLTPNSLIYDDQQERWIAISESSELLSRLFPEKKSLGLKAVPCSPEKPSATETLPSVEKLLSGDQSSPENILKMKAKRRQQQISILTIPVLGTLLAGTAIATLSEPISESMRIFRLTGNLRFEHFFQPAAILGVLDALLTLVLLLKVLPGRWILQIRAVMGTGYWGTLYGIQMITGDPLWSVLLLASLAHGTALFVLTLSPNPKSFWISSIFGILGMLVILGFNLFIL